MSFQISDYLAADSLPPVQSEMPSVPVRTPGVWYGYFLYCGLMTLLYMFATVCFALVGLNAEDFVMNSQTELSAAAWTQIGWFMAAVCFLFGAIHAIGMFSKNGKGAWILGIVLIGLGLTGMCTLPFAIFMLIGWLRHSTKEFFGIAQPLSATQMPSTY